MCKEFRRLCADQADGVQNQFTHRLSSGNTELVFVSHTKEEISTVNRNAFRIRYLSYYLQASAGKHRVLYGRLLLHTSCLPLFYADFSHRAGRCRIFDSTLGLEHAKRTDPVGQLQYNTTKGMKLPFRQHLQYFT